MFAYLLTKNQKVISLIFFRNRTIVIGYKKGGERQAMALPQHWAQRLKMFARFPGVVGVALGNSRKLFDLWSWLE